MSYVPAEIRRAVIARADNRCEYCLRPQWNSLLLFQIDHIVAVKHGGESELENLCLSCAHCNLHKGTDLTSIDPTTLEITALFNPRRDKWTDHFKVDGERMIGLTAIGRTSERLLQLNSPMQEGIRRELLSMNFDFLPPTDDTN